MMWTGRGSGVACHPARAPTEARTWAYILVKVDSIRHLTEPGLQDSPVRVWVLMYWRGTLSTSPVHMYRLAVALSTHSLFKLLLSVGRPSTAGRPYIGSPALGTRRPGNPQFPFPRDRFGRESGRESPIPDLAGIGKQGVPDSRFHTDLAGNRSRIGVPIRRKSGNRGYPSV